MIFIDTAEIPQYTNMDLNRIVTLVKVDKFVTMLKAANYEASEVAFLEQGFKHGFDIGYEGPQERCSESENLPFTVGNESILWSKIMKEVQLGRVAGPFDKIPCDNYIQLQVGLVPKAGNQTRSIFHLSYDFKKDGLKSLNHYTPKVKCTVKYRDLDFAVSTYMDFCFEVFKQDIQDCHMENVNYDGNIDHDDLKRRWKRQFYHHQKVNKQILAGKSDLKSAFRILGLSRSSWKWLIFKARNPTTGHWCYFVDKCLPFGASISCALFQHFSDALCWLIDFRLGEKRRQIMNYLDDFLFITITLMRCNYMIAQFLRLCEEISVPVSMDKTEWGTTLIVFLGKEWQQYDLVHTR